MLTNKLSKALVASMRIVAGLSLKNLQPRVWDPHSPYYLPDLTAVMVSYGDFHRMPARRRKAMEVGVRAYLDVPEHVLIYLDNGAFSFIRRQHETPRDEYEEFVRQARPDWWPIPQDYIPIPSMEPAVQRSCFERTMAVNVAYDFDGYVPIIHVGTYLDQYLEQLALADLVLAKRTLGLGGIVPNLLRAPKALPYQTILDGLGQVRAQLDDHELHLFGVGGTATVHLARLLEIDSIDSSGWRNRAARGIVQLPGCGDRLVASLGAWRGREPSAEEWSTLTDCPCPACGSVGLDGLKASGIAGFCNRATHNLWVLLQEAHDVDARLADGSYDHWFQEHLDNSIYLPLIQRVVHSLRTDPA